MKNLKRYLIAFACALVSFVVVMELLFWVSRKSGAGYDINAMKSLAVGFNGYKDEYQKWPDTVMQSSNEMSAVRTVGELVTIIIGENATHNPRQIRFVEAPEARDNKMGLLKTNDAYRIVDSWGEPYYLLFDKNADGSIANPNVTSDIKTLNAGVLLYSSGPDKNPDTWEDNITSW